MDADKLITLVKNHEAIWHKGCPEYKDRAEKEKAWFEVGRDLIPVKWAEMDTEEKHKFVTDCKNKWRNIRDSFLKYNNQGNSGDAASKKKKYVYANALHFLLGSLKKRSTSDSVGVEESTPSSLEASDEHLDQASSNEPESDSVLEPAPSQRSKEKQKRPPKLTPFQEKLFLQLEGTNPATAAPDEDKDFLMSVLPKIKRLNESQKLDFQMHVLKFFVDVNKQACPVTQPDPEVPNDPPVQDPQYPVPDSGTGQVGRGQGRRMARGRRRRPLAD